MCLFVCVYVSVCVCVFVGMCMCVCVLDKAPNGQEVGLSPSAMIILASRWHAVKWADIIVIAIGTIGYLYLNSMSMSP